MDTDLDMSIRYLEIVLNEDRTPSENRITLGKVDFILAQNQNPDFGGDGSFNAETWTEMSDIAKKARDSLLTISSCRERLSKVQ